MIRIAHPTAAPVGIVASIPHSGRVIEATFRHGLTADPDALWADWYTAHLYSFLPDLGITTITTEISRFVADPNRDPSSGHGDFWRTVVPANDPMGVSIYGRPLAQAEVDERIAVAHRPFHRLLDVAIDDVRRTHGRVLLLDLHSFGVPLEADVVIGDGNATTAQGGAVAIVEAAFGAASYATARNLRFAGGWIVRRFTADRAVDAIALELNQRCYLDAAEVDAWPDIQRSGPTCWRPHRSASVPCSPPSPRHTPPMAEGVTPSAVCPDGAYDDDSKLAARQTLWSYEEKTPGYAGRVRAAIDLRGEETIVDVGCGNGNDLLQLAQGGHQGALIGFDLSMGMLNATHQRVPGERLGLADAQFLAVADAVADVVLAMHMLYHVPDISQAVSECRRVMRPGGVFLASTNGSNTMPELLEVWRAAIDEVTGGSSRLDRLSMTRLSLENGGSLLSTHFDEVECRRFPGAVVVPDANVMGDYVRSSREFYAAAVGGDEAWEDVARPSKMSAHE